MVTDSGIEILIGFAEIWYEVLPARSVVRAHAYLPLLRAEENTVVVANILNVSVMSHVASFEIAIAYEVDDALVSEYVNVNVSVVTGPADMLSVIVMTGKIASITIALLAPSEPAAPGAGSVSVAAVGFDTPTIVPPFRVRDPVER
jgi:hypothetical protein